MKLHRISGCQTGFTQQIQNLEFTLTNTAFENVYLELEIVGPRTGELPPSSECSSYELDEDEFVSSMTIVSTPNYIESIGVITNKGYKNWGEQLAGTITTWDFDSSNELVGIYGQGINEALASFGVIVFKSELCADGFLSETDNTGSSENNQIEFEMFHTSGGLNREISGSDRNPILVGIFMIGGVVLLSIILGVIVCCQSKNKKEKSKPNEKFEAPEDDKEKQGGVGARFRSG